MPESNYQLGYSKTFMDILLSKRSAKRDAGYLLDKIKPIKSGKLLDCGCGMGNITIEIAEALPNWEIIGIDVEPTMISIAKKSAETKQINNVHFQQADIYHLPFEAEEFNAIYMNTIFSHLPEKKHLLNNLVMLLHKPGYIAIGDVDHGGNIFYPDTDILIEAMKMRSKAMSLAGGDYFIGRRLKAVLLDAGASSVTVTALGEANSSPEDINAMANYLIYEWETAFSKLAIKQGLLTKERIEQYKQAWAEFAKDPDAFLFMLICQAIGYFE